MPKIMKMFKFVKVMHSRAKCGIANIYCLLSVCPPVCNAGDLWSYRLGYFEKNYTNNQLRVFTPRSPNTGNLVQVAYVISIGTEVSYYLACP